MAAVQHVRLDDVVLDGLQRGLPSVPSDDGLAAPFAAGAEARDIVDFCVRAELPALFIDQRGRVFHVTPAARDLLRGALRLRDGELVADTTRGTERLRDAVSRAVCAMDDRPTARHLVIGKSDPVRVTVLDYPRRSADQLLRAVVLLRHPHGLDEAAAQALAAGLTRD